MLLPSLAATVAVLAVLGSRVDLSDLVSLVTSSPPEGSPTPSIPCMLTRCSLGWIKPRTCFDDCHNYRKYPRCGSETFACLTDRQCLKALACLVPCGSDQVLPVFNIQGMICNQACTFHCITNYETDTFHNLNRCNIQVLQQPQHRSINVLCRSSIV